MTKRAGFSLFELLLSLALLGLIAAALSSSLGLGLRLYDRTRGESTQSLDALAARTRLRGWLARALPPNTLTGLPLDQFDGSTDGFSFVTLAPTHFSDQAAALLVSVSLEGDALVMHAEPIAEDGLTISSIEVTLLDDANGVRFRYFDAAPDIEDWRLDWPTDMSRLPDLVQITIDETGGRWPPLWPEFTVRPMLQAKPGS